MTSDRTSITRAARTVPGFRQQLIDNLYHTHGQAIRLASKHAAAAFRDRDGWTRMSILNPARSGFFSSDRTIRQYSEEICRVPSVTVE